ncbi:hypothetical protein H6F54_00235 [Coleofasciculus sp. FACHB-501]|nr:hypothetical protein [Coleofasciculus sp. FACHB-501]
MTDPSIHNLGMTNTEYAALTAKGYNPALERRLIEVGEDSDQARKLTQFVGLLQDKPPETEAEWEEVMSAWEACGERLNFDEQR